MSYLLLLETCYFPFGIYPVGYVDGFMSEKEFIEFRDQFKKERGIKEESDGIITYKDKKWFKNGNIISVTECENPFVNLNTIFYCTYEAGIKDKRCFIMGYFHFFN